MSGFSVAQLTEPFMVNREHHLKLSSGELERHEWLSPLEKIWNLKNCEITCTFDGSEDDLLQSFDDDGDDPVFEGFTSDYVKNIQARSE